MGNDTRGLPQDAVDQLTARLAALADLRLPAQLRRQQPEGPPQGELRRHLAQLLRQDPGVFLERHGASLTEQELEHFQCLRGDYEVDFYLRALEQRGDVQRRGAAARNRRLAAMRRLERDGSFFSEHEMRERQPALHHQYIGQYRPPEALQAEEGCQAGTVLASSIMRQQEELGLRQRSAAEAARWRDAQPESETDSEEEEEEDGGEEQHERRGVGGPAIAEQQPQRGAAAPPAQGEGGEGGGGAGAAQGEGEGGEELPGFAVISEEEQADNAATFLDLMRQRFLAGQEEGVDYAAIDADAELDDDWAEEAGRDAEDKYFGGE